MAFPTTLGRTTRRWLCAVLGALVSLWAEGAQAQQARRIPRIGYLAAVSASADAPRLSAFRKGLSDLGYVEGQNIVVEYRHESGDLQRLPGLAAELLRQDIDVLVAVTSNAAQAAQRTTTTTPIVFMGVTDPIAIGLARSLAHPGGNSTGITNVAAILSGKRLELLKEVLPQVTRIAVMWDPQAPGSVPQWDASQAPARKLGLTLVSMPTSHASDYAAAFAEAVRSRSGAVWVTLNPVANSNQKLIADLALAQHLPTICARGDYAENGCMLAYGPGYGTEGKDGARYVDRILKGARPADLPIEQPTKFELLINLKTVKQLGLTIPRSVLNRADKVIH